MFDRVTVTERHIAFGPEIYLVHLCSLLILIR